MDIFALKPVSESSPAMDTSDPDLPRANILEERLEEDWRSRETAGGAGHVEEAVAELDLPIGVDLRAADLDGCAARSSSESIADSWAVVSGYIDLISGRLEAGPECLRNSLMKMASPSSELTVDALPRVRKADCLETGAGVLEGE